MTQNNLLVDKSIAFAIRIVNCYNYLTETKNEYTMSKQVFRSGTSIGAIIQYCSLKNDVDEIIRILISTIKTTKKNNNEQ